MVEPGGISHPRTLQALSLSKNISRFVFRIIQKAGKTCQTQVLLAEKYQQCLHAKLREEVEEYLTTKSERPTEVVWRPPKGETGD
jgi:hypothetical protein